MKRALIIAVAGILSLFLCACQSEAVTTAKKAYAEANYEEVVTALAEEEITDAEVANMLLVSKIYVAYDSGEYQEVVNMLSDGETVSPEMEEILAISKANLAYKEEQYHEVISLLQTVNNYAENELYKKAIEVATNNAIASYDIKSLVDIYGMDASIEQNVYQQITNACADFNYDAFCFMEGLIGSLSEGNLKDVLKSYSAANQKNKTKAFMKGEWKIIYDEEGQDIGIVKLHVHEEDEKCVGFLALVSEFMKDYHYEENDVYWQEFVFEGNQPVSVYNTTRYSNGTIGGKVASVELDMEKGEMTIHVTGTVSPDRVYTKVS